MLAESVALTCHILNPAQLKKKLGPKMSESYRPPTASRKIAQHLELTTPNLRAKRKHSDANIYLAQWYITPSGRKSA